MGIDTRWNNLTDRTDVVAAPRQVTLTVTKYVFDAPDTIEAGYTTIAGVTGFE